MRENSSSWKARFFTIWTGQQFSLVGSHLVQFALVWWLTKTTGSATVLATASLLAMLPQIVLGPFTGALVDRFNRRRVMIAADGAIALASAGLAYLFWTDAIQVWHVYLVMVIRSIGGGFHWPAMQASTSLMVPKVHLSRVAGLNQTMNGAMNIVAPPLGAILLSLLPMHGILGIDVGTAVIAILPLFFIPIPQPLRTATAGEAKPAYFAEVREGLTYVWGWRGLSLVLVMATVINFAVNPAFSLLPLLVTKHFCGEAMQLGWLNSAFGIGVVLGGLVLSVWGGFRRRVSTSLMGIVGMGFGILTIGVVPGNGLWIAMGGIFLAGVMNPICNGPLFALIQSEVAPEVQGRVFMVMNSTVLAMTPLSLAVAGPLADILGIQFWYIVGGITMLVMGIGAFFVPAIVHLEHNHPEKEPAKAAVTQSTITD